MRERLISLLEPFDNWENNITEEENLAAKDALKKFLKYIENFKPSKKYAKSHITLLHTSYLRHLVVIKKALMERKYARACNEIITLLNQEPFLQARVLNNLIRLLEEELNN
ncbi:hypothetical protein Csac_1389 [Caldicellulosiruptor saccharolyticus DSM 8903]|uniref:Uncharacterized protein n=1 Tax=Caldicellulosiruptor saccharolyticus (strain ATCC 43494 / DSM 8903 / Tp8T 6331) TaxID=351627 RepID=A4XJA6_CALS8|nr:hypothetical protein [Caldicellulosiruptor saccharolyticus]ABP66991.1 hypothetical protein Csac_1389 [Caldicellulosiruptor saccharolyticus DSM 8903]